MNKWLAIATCVLLVLSWVCYTYGGPRIAPPPMLSDDINDDSRVIVSDRSVMGRQARPDGLHFQGHYHTAWIQQFGTEGDDVCVSVAVDRADNIIVAGTTNWAFSLKARVLADGYVAKYDPNGIRLWYQPIGTDKCDEVYGVAVDATGNIYAAGYTLGLLGAESYGQDDILLAKYDPNGTRLWVRQAGTDLMDRACQVATDGNGDVYIAGYTQGQMGTWHYGGFDAFVAKYTSDGQFLWVRQFGTNVDEWPESLAVDRAGSVYLAGGTDGDLVEENIGEADIFLVKYDGRGNERWMRQWGTPKIETPQSMAVDPNGDLLIALETTYAPPHSGRFDAQFGKYDPNGTPLWTQQIGTPVDDSPTSIGVDPQRGILLTGVTGGDLAGKNAGGADETNDVFLALFDWQGNLQYSCQLGTPNNDLAQSGALDGRGNVLIVGHTRGPLGGTAAKGYDSFIVKLTPDDSPAVTPGEPQR